MHRRSASSAGLKSTAPSHDIFGNVVTKEDCTTAAMSNAKHSSVNSQIVG